MKRSGLPVPTESVEQICLFRWASLQSAAHPELNLMYHIPNGGKRGLSEAKRFKAEGVKAGVPDVCLPVPCGEYHGLYVEMKRTEGGTLSPDQKEWLSALRDQGYKTAVAKGWTEAAEIISNYLNF